MSQLWEHISLCLGKFDEYMEAKWLTTQPYEMEEEVKKLSKRAKEIKVDKRCNAYIGIIEAIKKWQQFLPLIGELRSDSMRDRHWEALKKAINQDFEIDDNLLLKDVFALNLNKFSDEVEEITDQARQEERMEKTLNKLEETWKDMEFQIEEHKGTGVSMLRMGEEDFELLEEQQVNVNAMFSSRFLATFEDQCIYWQKHLAGVSEVVQLLQEVQRLWSFLENLFIHSEEVKKELPKDTERFVGIDQEVKAILAEGNKVMNFIKFCNQDGILHRLEEVEKQLGICEKALMEFMEGKRRAFPRFYFVSTNDLLDILSNGNSPHKVMKHMSKIFQAINTLDLKEGGERPFAQKMISNVGVETVDFIRDLKLMGKVENYLADVIDIMRETLKDLAGKSVSN